jgi:hypothetical protein
MQCAVCHTQNDEFAMTCVKCHGFLQNHVTNLDLFETIWDVIEHPTIAFRRIRLADHKNYAVSLFSFFGIGVSFSLMWLFRLGIRFSSLLELIVFGIGSGIVIGILLAPVIATLFWVVAKIGGGHAGFRDSLAIAAFSLTPILVGIILLLPIELLTFGMYLFTGNPHPMALKPGLYMTLIGLDIVSVIWTIFLLFVGTMVGHQIKALRSAIIALIVAAVSVAILFFSGAAIPGV